LIFAVQKYGGEWLPSTTPVAQRNAAILLADRNTFSAYDTSALRCAVSHDADDSVRRLLRCVCVCSRAHVASYTYFGFDFVHDSVRNGRLMDLSLYQLNGLTGPVDPLQTQPTPRAAATERARPQRRVRSVAEGAAASSDADNEADDTDDVEVTAVSDVKRSASSSAAVGHKRPLSATVRSGRSAYTAEEDAALIEAVRRGEQRGSTQKGGNKFWQTIERELGGSHSWQSLKDRYD
jgi:hypothetical protein